MTPREVADLLDRVADDAKQLAHDIRQRISPGYSHIDQENLDAAEIARLRGLGDLQTPAMQIAFAKPTGSAA